MKIRSRTQRFRELRHGGHTCEKSRRSALHDEPRHAGNGRRERHLRRAGSLQDRGMVDAECATSRRGAYRRPAGAADPRGWTCAGSSRLPTPPAGCCPRGTAPAAAFAAKTQPTSMRQRSYCLSLPTADASRSTIGRRPKARGRRTSPGEMRALEARGTGPPATRGLSGLASRSRPPARRYEAGVDLGHKEFK